MKVCSRCDRALSADDFARDKHKPTGVKSWCKACDNERSKAYYAANRDARIASVRAYQNRRGVQVPKARFCSCGAPTTSPKHHYCDACRARAQARRKSPPRAKRPEHLKRYDWQHKLERRRVEKIVDAGRAICARCTEPILPGSLWDLDHADDGQSYRGPAHRYCNRSAGAKRGNRMRAA